MHGGKVMSQSKRRGPQMIWPTTISSMYCLQNNGTCHSWRHGGMATNRISFTAYNISLGQVCTCESQLKSSTVIWLITSKMAKQTDLIIHFSKVFDKVDHQRILAKLDNYGIKSKAWLAHLFSNCSQTGILEAERSV